MSERTCVRCNKTKPVVGNFRNNRNKCNKCLSEEGCARAARKRRERQAQEYINRFRREDAAERRRQAAAENIYGGI